MNEAWMSWMDLVEKDLNDFYKMYSENANCDQNPKLLNSAMNCIDHIPFLLLELKRYKHNLQN